MRFDNSRRTILLYVEFMPPELSHQAGGPLTCST